MPRPGTASAEQRVLEHQIRSLRAMVGSPKGPVPDDVLVSVDAGLIQDTLDAATPWSGTVADRFTVKVRRAQVKLEGGVALVLLSGGARPLDGDGSTEARLRLYAAIDNAAVDSRTHVLHAAVSLIAFEVEDEGGSRSASDSLMESLGGLGLEAFARLLSGIDIPVAVDQDVELPRLGPHPVAVPPLEVPASLAATGVWAFRGRLWIALDAATPVRVSGEKR